MAHNTPDFETKDTLGKTLQYASTVGTSATAYPPSASTQISSFLLRNPNTNGVNDVLSVSLDGGVNFLTLSRGEFVGWGPKNNNSNMPITQIFIKASGAGKAFQLLIDLEPQ